MPPPRSSHFRRREAIKRTSESVSAGRPISEVHEKRTPWRPRGPGCSVASHSDGRLPAAHITPQICPIARKLYAVLVNPPLKSAYISGLVPLQALRAPRLPEPAMAERPILTALSGSKLAPFIAQACLIGVQTRAIALNLSPVRPDIGVVSKCRRYRKKRDACGKEEGQGPVHRRAAFMG